MLKTSFPTELVRNGCFNTIKLYILRMSHKNVKEPFSSFTSLKPYLLKACFLNNWFRYNEIYSTGSLYSGEIYIKFPTSRLKTV